MRTHRGRSPIDDLGRRLLHLPGTRRLGLVALIAALVVVGLLGLLGRILPEKPDAHAAPLVVARADVHVETDVGGKDLELNLAISQTSNDCQAQPQGQVCLRYSVLLDEQPTEVGYGLIPASHLRVSASVVTLTVDTRTISTFVHVVGDGGSITVRWKLHSSRSVMHGTSAQGNVVGYTLPTTQVTAALVVAHG